MTMNRQNLILVPGLLCTGELWKAQTAALFGVANVMIADNRAHDSVQMLAKDILQSAPATFALAGLSMGGYIALEMFRQAPERIERLALIDTRAEADGPEQIQRRRDFMDLARRGKFKGVTPQLLPLLVHKDHLENETLRQVIFDMAAEVGVEGFLRQQQAIIDRPDSRADLPHIKCPALVMCGAQDQLTPVSVHEALAAAIPGAQLRIIENAGHLTPLEQPDVVTAYMREWLKAS